MKLLGTNTGSIYEVTNPILLHAQRRRAEVTRSLVQPQSNDMILDIGCGDGYQLRYFANIPIQIVGIDISKLRIRSGEN